MSDGFYFKFREKSLGLTDSTIIGIKLCPDPQISEHCPTKMPGRALMVIIWLMRPGTASTLLQSLGILQE